MFIGSAEDFAFVMPTKNRPRYVGRALENLKRQGYTGLLLVVDASDDVHHEATASALEAYGSMQIRHYRPCERGNNWIETAEACETIASRLVLWHHDDDFYFLDAVQRAATALADRPDAMCAQGREAFLTLRRDGERVGIKLDISPRFSYLAATAPERLRQAFANYCHLFFAVTRREVFISTARAVAASLKQAWFDQYAWSLIVAGRGAALLTDDLYAFRERHATNHSSLLGPYDRWPLIAASPDFSSTFADFKTCLQRNVAESEGELATVIDQGLAHIIARQYAANSAPDAVDRSLVEACRKPGTPEHARVAAIVQALGQHPETI